MDNFITAPTHLLNLCDLSVGRFATLQLNIPAIPATASSVEVIITAKDGTASAYPCAYSAESRTWSVDVDAGQFPEAGRQRYEVAYKYDGKQWWLGRGWITVVDAVVQGIVPKPQPAPAGRYVVMSVNGVYADENGNVTIAVPSPDGMVKSVNGIAPDEKGNVALEVGGDTVGKSNLYDGTMGMWIMGGPNLGEGDNLDLNGRVDSLNLSVPTPKGQNGYWLFIGAYFDENIGPSIDCEDTRFVVGDGRGSVFVGCPTDYGGVKSGYFTLKDVLAAGGVADNEYITRTYVKIAVHLQKFTIAGIESTSVEVNTIR